MAKPKRNQPGEKAGDLKSIFPAQPLEASASVVVGIVTSTLEDAENLPDDARALALRLSALPEWAADPAAYWREFKEALAPYSFQIERAPGETDDQFNARLLEYYPVRDAMLAARSPALALALSATGWARRVPSVDPIAAHRNLIIASVKAGALMALVDGFVSDETLAEAIANAQKTQLDDARDKRYAASRDAYSHVTAWTDANWHKYTHQKTTKTLRAGDPNLTKIAKVIDGLSPRLVSEDVMQIRRWLTRWNKERKVPATPSGNP